MSEPNPEAENYPWDKGFIEAMEGKVAEGMEEHSSGTFRWLNDDEKEKILEKGNNLPQDLPTRRYFVRSVVMELRDRSSMGQEEFDKFLELRIERALDAKAKYGKS